MPAGKAGNRGSACGEQDLAGRVGAPKRRRARERNGAADAATPQQPRDHLRRWMREEHVASVASNDGVGPGVLRRLEEDFDAPEVGHHWRWLVADWHRFVTREFDQLVR